jgi:CheY-like chemotaxis protein
MARILIVEDELNFCRPLAAYLRDDGHAVACAADAGEALRFIRSATPDLAVVDLMLAEGNGKEVIAAIRTAPWPAYIPIVVVTATTSPKVQEELLPFVEGWFTKSTVSLRTIKQSVTDSLLPGSPSGSAADWPCGCAGRC